MFEAVHPLIIHSLCYQANLQIELTDLKKEVSSMKITQLSEARNKQVQNLWISKQTTTNDMLYKNLS